MYIENSRSKFDKNRADVWMKLKYSKPKTLPNNRKVNSVVMRVSVLCDKNEIMYQSVEERLNDKLVHSSDNPNKKYEETVPGSESDAILKFLCQIAKNR
jgi:regulatory protein YycH of two-component signal transduction system YycFG